MTFWVLQKKTPGGLSYWTGEGDSPEIMLSKHYRSKDEALVHKKARQLLNHEPLEQNLESLAIGEDEPNIETLTKDIAVGSLFIPEGSDPATSSDPDPILSTSEKWEGEGGQFSGAGASGSFPAIDQEADSDGPEDGANDLPGDVSPFVKDEMDGTHSNLSEQESSRSTDSSDSDDSSASSLDSGSDNSDSDDN